MMDPLSPRNSPASAASPLVMPAKNDRPDFFGLWMLLALGLLLMLAAALAGAEEPAFTVKRTDHFNGTLPPGSTLRVENISGEVVAVSGKEFSAVVNISASAPTKAKAEELLGATTILQKREGEELALQSIWPEIERGSGKAFRWAEGESSRHARRRALSRCEDCRITAQYRVTIPSGVRGILRTVNGEVRVDGADGDLEVRSVNGPVTVAGGRRGVSAETVNGRIDLTMQALPAAAAVRAKTVNGSVVVTLPKDAKFELSASTMNGAIASTFPLPARHEPEQEDVQRKTERPGETAGHVTRRMVVRGDGEEVLVNVEALQKEIEEAMKQVDIEVRVHDALRDANREMRRLGFLGVHRDYNGSIGQGGGKLRISTLNGTVLVLAAGTREAEAKSLVPERRGFVVTVPAVRVRPKAVVRVVPATPATPVVQVWPEESVVRGDVSGDFLATSGGGTYRIGRVSGNVKILTRSGEIHVASAGAGADLKTLGGDIRIGPVAGDLRAKTLAGDIQAGSISGSIALETSGGDIRVERVGGSAGVRTGGGDISLASVMGGIDAQTGGGDVRATLLSREAKGGVSIRDSGGDVTLTLPADFRGDVDLEVRDSGSDEVLIRSDFPEIAVVRQHGLQRASGSLNGGGPRVVVRTNSGTIRLKKAAAAGS